MYLQFLVIWDTHTHPKKFLKEKKIQRVGWGEALSLPWLQAWPWRCLSLGWNWSRLERYLFRPPMLSRGGYCLPRAGLMSKKMWLPLPPGVILQRGDPSGTTSVSPGAPAQAPTCSKVGPGGCGLPFVSVHKIIP